MIRTMTRVEMAQRVNRDILRGYNVRMHVVSSVDNQGGQCEFCAEVDALVVANVYLTDTDQESHCADCCLACIAYVLDGHVQTDPAYTVTIEIAQGAR